MNTVKSLTLLSAILALAACNKETQTEMKENSKEAVSNVSEGMKKTGDSIAATWSNISDYTVEKKNVFTTAIESAVSKMDAKVEKWKVDSDNISEAAMKNFKNAQEALNEQLEKAGDATAEGWENTKEAVQQAWGDLENAYDEIKTEAS